MKYYSHGRLNKIFEAIDSDDYELYWKHRGKWHKKHGYHFNGQPKRSRRWA